MRIDNQTPFSNRLIKRLMRLAAVNREAGKTLRIVQDRRFKGNGHLGRFETYTDDDTYIVRIRQLGDTLTLAHELRHLAQYQRGLFEAWTVEELEQDAEGFESWLEVNGY